MGSKLPIGLIQNNHVILEIALRRLQGLNDFKATLTVLIELKLTANSEA